MIPRGMLSPFPCPSSSFLSYPPPSSPPVSYLSSRKLGLTTLQATWLGGTELVNQGILGDIIQQIFPNINIITNSRGNSSLRSVATGRYVELDIWVPELHLCFEFQDVYHYTTTWYSQAPLSTISEYDNEKKAEARRNSISLVDIPCWWNGDAHSLVESVLFQRPDLSGSISMRIPSGATSNSRVINQHMTTFIPIALNPPSDMLKHGRITHVGELMLASFPGEMTVTKSISSSNVWWMGEKYDGVRVCWHPKESQLFRFSRSGLVLSVERTASISFPKTFLDGEAWFGRGAFSKTQSLVASATDLVAWHFLRIVAFDDVPLPTVSVLLLYREEEDSGRESEEGLLSDFFECGHTVAYRALCKSEKHMLVACKLIIKGGGEGVIIRKYSSVYEHGRSSNLLKIKASREDSEGIVTAVHSDYVVVKLPDGQMFRVPAASVRVATTLTKGDVVSFSYQSFSRKAVPVDPKIVRIRTDLSWKDVVYNYSQETTHRVREREHSAHGRWSTEKADNFRSFFEEYARSRNIDPLLPESWYDLSLASIKGYPGGKTVLVYAKGGIAKTLSQAFPEIGLIQSKFDINYNALEDVRSRRKWFFQVAKALGINPLVPENWYKLEVEKISNIRGTKTIMRYYSQNLAKALIHLFPEVKFDPSKFRNIPISHWQDINNRRSYFETLAKRMQLDPLIPEDLYQLTHTVVISRKGGLSVIGHHGGNYVKAIVSLFSELNLDPTKFMIPDSYFDIGANRRWFFQNIATKNGVDFLAPEQWYSISKDIILATQGADAVLKRYSGNWVKALVNVFPELDLDEFKFRFIPNHFWQDMQNRRWLFEAFANREGFDSNVASHWYSCSRDLFVHKSMQGVLRLYSGSIVEALSDIFPHIQFEQHKFPKIPGSYLTDIRNRQFFFEDFAEKKGFNPFVAENWYSIPFRSILAHKVSQTILRAYSGNILKALLHLYPKIGLDDTRFHYSGTHWQNATNRKRFYEAFAQYHGFDPLVLDNWNTVSRNSVLAFEGGASLLSYYGGRSFAADLDLLFHGEKRDHNLISKPGYYWSNMDNQRTHLMKFAAKRGFDPLIAENWYHVTTAIFGTIHKGKSLLQHHNNSLINMLLQHFPNIGLDAAKFSSVPRNYWQNEDNRKRLLEAFAKENGFDPKDPARWYSVSRAQISQHKGGKAVLMPYGNSVVQALVHLFPDIGVDSSMVLHSPRRRSARASTTPSPNPSPSLPPAHL